MIVYFKGNILKSRAARLVVPVNTVGVMGAGLAKVFAEEFPAMLEPYQSWCRSASGGSVGSWQVPNHAQSVVWFASKEHWRNPSRIEWIEQGLKNLKTQIGDGQWTAIPLVGAGLGGLRSFTIKALIEKHFRESRHHCMEVWEL